MGMAWWGPAALLRGSRVNPKPQERRWEGGRGRGIQVWVLERGRRQKGRRVKRGPGPARRVAQRRKRLTARAGRARGRRMRKMKRMPSASRYVRLCGP